MSLERRGQIVGLLVEGMSMRAISRVTGVARNTIDKLLTDLGDACAEFMDGEMVNLTPARIEADEIWSFIGSKAKNVPEGKEDERRRDRRAILTGPCTSHGTWRCSSPCWDEPTG